MPLIWLALAFACLGLPVLASAADAKVAEHQTASEVDAAEVEWQLTERGGGRRGGEMVVALTAEPRTFLPLLAVDEATRAVVQRMYSSLVRRDGVSFEIQPALATAWTLSEDHRVLTLELRRGVRFSDGEGFDADDVVFSFRAAQDPAIGSPYRDTIVLDGEAVRAEKLGSHRVRLHLPYVHPSPLWLLVDVPILPEHLLGGAYREGRLADAWSVASDPSSLAGLGPFRLALHQPGRRVVLERNPHYWRRDAVPPAGVQLPYLDRLVFDFVADEDAKLLRFRTGASHMMARIPGDQFADLERRSRDGGRFVVRDLGPGLGLTLVIPNLNDVAMPEVAARQVWLRSSEFRRALALAVDRESIARIVYRGHATPVISDLSPGNRSFFDESLSAERRGMETADLERAGAHLQQAAFRRGEDGVWTDRSGQRVELTLVTNTSNEKHAAIANLLQEDFRRLGLDVTFVGLEFSSLVERLTQTFDYDLILLEFGGRDLDPSSSLNVWRVDGGSHFFRLGADSAAFEWEAEVDRLMRRQARETDFPTRRRMVLEVQEILAREAPFLFLVAPNVLVGAHQDLQNFAPSIFDPPTLWNSDELYWRSPDDRTDEAGRDSGDGPGAR